MDDFPFELNTEEKKPYTDKKLNNGAFIRTFDCNVLSEELVWHRDKSNRVIEILEGEGWEIQFDNGLPEKLIVGKTYIIPGYTYHRIKRGTTNLKIRVEETL
jgi:hypothetical protein